MEDPMIWFLLFVGLFAILMGLFQIPIWIMYVVLAVVLIFFLLRNPLLLGKDSEKMIAYLNKSKAPYLQFLYHFLHGDLSEAEQAMGKIRSKKSKRNSELMLLRERKQYGKAKELLAQMGGHKTKWYALSDIAIQEEDAEALKHLDKHLNKSP
jgi:ABC-type transport system involved in cytochrome bd biosynthesis fused ATPase/permease subunit